MIYAGLIFVFSLSLSIVIHLENEQSTNKKNNTNKWNQVIKYSYEQMNRVKGCTAHTHTHTRLILCFRQDMHPNLLLLFPLPSLPQPLLVLLLLLLLNGTYNAKVVCILCLASFFFFLLSLDFVGFSLHLLHRIKFTWDFQTPKSNTI